MTRRTNQAERPMLLDLRASSGKPLPELWGDIIVLDDVSSLLEHHEEYYTLVDNPEVFGVVCVALGAPPTPEDEVLLRLPRVLLQGEGVVLWIGDEHGVRWGPRDNRPRRVGSSSPSGLDQLISTLQIPEVFAEIVTRVGEFPERVAGPGLHLVSSRVEATDLAAALTTAVKALTMPSTGRLATEEIVDATRRVVALPARGETTLLVTGGSVDEIRARAADQLRAARQLAVSLGTWRSVIGSARPGSTTGSAVAQAAELLDQFRQLTVELLQRMDGNLRLGTPSAKSVVEMGIAHPVPASRHEIALELRHVVEDRLIAEGSHADLLMDLRWTAATVRPQGCPDTPDLMTHAPAVRREVPAFRTWPLPLWTLPIALISGAAGGFLPGPVWLRSLVGVLFALGWFLVGWLLLGRRPDQRGGRRLGAAVGPAAGTYGLAGVVGVLGGVVAAQHLPLSPVPTAAGIALLVTAALLLVVVPVVSWRSAVHHFVAQLGLPELHEELGQLTGFVQDIVAAEWLPSDRRQVLAEAAIEVATGLEEITRALTTTTERLFADPAPLATARPPDTAIIHEEAMQPVAPELFAIVRGDLVAIIQKALEPAWAAIETAQRTPPGVYAQRTKQLVNEYVKHLATDGLMTAPVSTTDRRPRDRYLARSWSESPAAVDALRADGESDMVQLCRSRQLSYLNAYGPPTLLRFAPLPLQQILEANGQRLELGTDIIWTSASEQAGSVRLLPLRLETVKSILGGTPPAAG